MSTKIHQKNVHENSTKKRISRGHFVHEKSPKVSTKIHLLCLREVCQTFVTVTDGSNRHERLQPLLMWLSPEGTVTKGTIVNSLALSIDHHLLPLSKAPLQKAPSPKAPSPRAPLPKAPSSNQRNSLPHLDHPRFYRRADFKTTAMVKFRFSEKATKICAIFLMVLTFA